MNINNPLIRAFMNKLQSINPQGYNFANNLIKNNGNVDPIVKQMLNQVTPEQKQQVLNTAKGYGVPGNYLAQLQNKNKS